MLIGFLINIGIIVVIIVAVPLIFGMFFIVKEKEAAIVTRLGKFVRVHHAGLSIKLPWPIEAVAFRQTLMTSQHRVKIQPKTKDNVFVDLPITIQLRVMIDKVRESFYEMDNPIEQITALISNLIKAKVNSMDIHDVFSAKDEFAKVIAEELSGVMNNCGFEIVNVLVEDPELSDELKAIFERVIAATRDLEAAELEKKSALARGAEMEAEALKIKTDARRESAKATAKAIIEACKGLNIPHGTMLDFFRRLEGYDALTEAAAHGNTIIFADGGGQQDIMAQLIAAMKAANIIQPAASSEVDSVDESTEETEIEE